ncbi:hypothetical protein BCR39DRAFT_100387 [Naematelia encephala]|uniref:Uncharacterized protein n=1 Tax=Naematelia encephala TaxID=71784 RepID=A0A1Y2B857_9TREE|nr:hypothetical protein BCR39DRAFT_100387 [Naematelia encephala]
MLSCLNHLMFGLLLPQSTAPPIFLVLIIAAIWWRERACIHSIVWLVALYYSISICSDTSSSTPLDTRSTGSLPLTSPVAGRNLLNLVSGAWFDPALVGYAGRYDQTITSQSAIQSSKAQRTAITDLPRGYVDLSLKGLGFIVDLGWRRTEEGLAWEQESWRDTGMLPDGDMRGELRAKEKRVLVGTDSGGEHGEEDVVTGWFRWNRTSFLGSCKYRQPIPTPYTSSSLFDTVVWQFPS